MCQEFLKSWPLEGAYEGIHTGVKPFICTKCDKSFSRSSHLKTHERIHSGMIKFKSTYNVWQELLNIKLLENPWEDPLRRDSIQVHKVWRELFNIRLFRNTWDHKGEKPFKCTKCHTKFSRSRSLKEHERTHTGEKAGTCLKWDKSFSKAGHLKEREGTHMGEKC